MLKILVVIKIRTWTVGVEGKGADTVHHHGLAASEFVCGMRQVSGIKPSRSTCRVGGTGVDCRVITCTSSETKTLLVTKLD